MFILSMSLISKAFAPDSIFGRDRIENKTGRNCKDLEEMLGSAKTLKRNNGEYKEILIGPSMDPRFFGSVKSVRRSVFSYCPKWYVGFGPKSRGADVKATTTLQISLLRNIVRDSLFRDRVRKVCS
jgi:hypothetical protein